ncbi:MAG TPA: CHAD domain-containing protein [Bryobacteraceae bacterium]|jgi:CHAD domain-containing protein
MSFRLTKEESFSDEIRRIVLEQLTKAADQLSNPKKVDRGVHEARRCIKKVRGVLRLIQPEMRSVYEAENGQLRALGRGLADLRDDAVVLEVFDSLLPKRGNRFDAVRRGLETKHTADVTKIFRETMTGLRAIAKRVEYWPVTHDVDTAMSSGFQATYQRGKKALGKALENASPENLHLFRKRVKEHRFHLSLLFGDETKRLDDLRQLEVLLGDDHNLSVLRDRLDQNPALYGDPLDVSAFQALLTRKQRQLQARALPLGRRLYAMEEADSLMPVSRRTA